MRINRGSLPSVPDPEPLAIKSDASVRKRGCRLCCYENLVEFPAEVNIHFPGYEGLEKPTVWVFPKMVVCLDCGYTDLSLAEPELRALERGLSNQVENTDESALRTRLSLNDSSQGKD